MNEVLSAIARTVGDLARTAGKGAWWLISSLWTGSPARLVLLLVAVVVLMSFANSVGAREMSGALGAFLVLGILIFVYRIIIRGK